MLDDNEKMGSGKWLAWYDMLWDMALDVLIRYRDGRPDYWSPFCHQSTLRNFWWPLAKRYQLTFLERLEVLHIKERIEAEQLLTEFKVVQSGVRTEDQMGEPKYADSILETLDRLLPVIQSAIDEWEKVDYISL